MSPRRPDTIAWVPSEKVPIWIHGYVGRVRAFRIESKAGRWILQPHLPTSYGYPRQETHPTVEAAQARAAEILADFLTELRG